MFKYIKKHNVAISFIIGILGTAFGFYAYYFPFHQDPELAIYQKETFDIFKLNKKIGSLNVDYKGVDIQQKNWNLTAYKLSLINSGDADIKAVDYSDLPFGLRVKNGFFVSVDITGGNDVFLKQNLRPTILDSLSLGFSKTIIEQGSSVDIEVLVMHPGGTAPLLSPVGKIAGVKTITYGPAPKPSTWEKLKRSKVLFFQLFLAIGSGILLFIIIGVTENYVRKRRKKRLLYLYGFPARELTEMEEQFVEFAVLPKKDFREILDTVIDDEKRGTFEKQHFKNKHVSRVQEKYDGTSSSESAKKTSRNYFIGTYSAVEVIIRNEWMRETEDEKLEPTEELVLLVQKTIRLLDIVI